MQHNEFLIEYFALRGELDLKCKELNQLHDSHLQCRAGCDQCCMDFSILPVEYFAIKAQAGIDLKKGMTPQKEGGCPFLINHQCVIYAARPMICRSQGLPLLFMGEEEWELSVCELNFHEFDFDEFTEENTFPQDTFNSRLYMLNSRFIRSLPGNPYGPMDLIPLKKLFDDKISKK
jgi:uncharacterized protein